MTATESQWTLQPYRTFSKPDIQFHKRLPRGHHGHICCHHLQSIGETQTSSPPKTRPFIRGFPKQAPSEMLLPLCFSSRNGFTFPRGFHPCWTGLLASCSECEHNSPHWGTSGEAYSPLTCGNTGRLPTLASVISFLDLRSQKIEVFQQLKVLGL